MNPLLLAMLAALALQGCAGANHAPDEALPVEKVYANSQCGGLDQPEAIWIADTEAWRQRYVQMVSLQITPPPLPVVDFSHNGVLLIAMGQQTTGGYGLNLAGTSATVREGVLTVRVEWREPLPGYAQTQVMTSPCLVVQLPEGAFSRIRIVDQAGGVRLEGQR